MLEKYTMPPTTLGNCSCIALLPAIHGSICSFCHENFSLDISGPMIEFFWVRFPCNHSYGYAHNVIMGRIVQTDSLTDFKKHDPIVCIPMNYSGCHAC